VHCGVLQNSADSTPLVFHVQLETSTHNKADI